MLCKDMEELDYSTMEYLGSIDNPDEIFHAEILLSGLGAIMDVAVAISVALSEIVEQKPEVKFVELFRSGREIGYDIMGTMINVLLFVFGHGLIPTCLIRMNNEVRFVTIVKLHIPCELCRFFVESIGIVLAIPVSIFITAVMMKLSVKKREKKMLIILGLILMIVVVLVGGDRGAMSLIALAGNILCLSLAIWLYAVGAPVFLVTAGAGILISCITLFYQNGTNIKTWSAFCGCNYNVCVICIYLSGRMEKWGGGLNEIQALGEDVFYYNMNLDISMPKVATAVIVLSTLGAVIDMALTVTTSVYEVKCHKPDIKMNKLVQSGMKIGKDVIGTTVNTLLFAYLGESLLLFAYLRMQNYSIELLLNSKILFQNCISMIFGAISCTMIMPVSAVLIAKNCELFDWMENSK